jgi:hypothetical protein
MYKMDKHLTPTCLKDIVPSKTSSYNKRSTFNYNVPTCTCILQIYEK